MTDESVISSFLGITKVFYFFKCLRELRYYDKGLITESEL